MFSNKVKAVGLFVVVLYVLYGGELVNVSRDPRRGYGGSTWPQDRPGRMERLGGPYGPSEQSPFGTLENPMNVSWVTPSAPTSQQLQGGGTAGY